MCRIKPLAKYIKRSCYIIYSQKQNDRWYGEAASEEEECTRKSIHGCGINRTVHWTVNQRHQCFADAEKRIHFTWGYSQGARVSVTLSIKHLLSKNNKIYNVSSVACIKYFITEQCEKGNSPHAHVVDARLSAPRGSYQT